MFPIMGGGRGRCPPRPPKPSMCMPSPPVPAAELLGEPLVELAPGLGNGVPLLLERREVAVVEAGRLGAVGPYLLALGLRRRRVPRAVVVYHHAVLALGRFAADEAPAHVFGHDLGVAFEGVTYTAGARGLEDEAVTLEDGHVAHLGGEVYRLTALTNERLLRRRAGSTGVHAVGVGVVPIVLVGDMAVGEESVDLLYAAAAAEEAGAAGVAPSGVLLHDHGVVRLHVLCRHREELGPPRVAVEAVFTRYGGDATVQDLHGLERLSVLLDAGVHEVGAGAVGARDVKPDGLRVDRAEHVEEPRHDDEAVAQRSRGLRAQHRAVGDVDLNDVGVAVVEEDGRVNGGDQEHPSEHLEHLLVEEEVHGAWDLLVRAGPVEVQSVALAPHGELELYGTVAETVVVCVVLQLESLVLGDELAYEPDDAVARPVQ